MKYRIVKIGLFVNDFVCDTASGPKYELRWWGLVDSGESVMIENVCVENVGTIDKSLCVVTILVTHWISACQQQCFRYPPPPAGRAASTPLTPSLPLRAL